MPVLLPLTESEFVSPPDVCTPAVVEDHQPLCAFQETDLVVLVDTSGSLEARIASPIAVAAKIAERLQIGPTRVRLAVVSFNEQPPVLEFGWDVYSAALRDKAEMVRRVEQMHVPANKAADVARAYQYLVYNMFTKTYEKESAGRRPQVIIVTDGQDAGSAAKRNKYKKVLADRGVAVHALGVGLGGASGKAKAGQEEGSLLDALLVDGGTVKGRAFRLAGTEGAGLADKVDTIVAKLLCDNAVAPSCTCSTCHVTTTPTSTLTTTHTTTATTTPTTTPTTTTPTVRVRSLPPWIWA